jgi:hypothetical protein
MSAYFPQQLLQPAAVVATRNKLVDAVLIRMAQHINVKLD